MIHAVLKIKPSKGAGQAYGLMKDRNWIDLMYIVRRPVPVFTVIAGEGQ